MRKFKLFHGYGDAVEPNVDGAFNRLMNMFQELDRMAMDVASQELNNRRNNYETENDILDLDVTLSDGLTEE
jgi:hypothetical protein